MCRNAGCGADSNRSPPVLNHPLSCVVVAAHKLMLWQLFRLTCTVAHKCDIIPLPKVPLMFSGFYERI